MDGSERLRDAMIRLAGRIQGGEWKQIRSCNRKGVLERFLAIVALVPEAAIHDDLFKVIQMVRRRVDAANALVHEVHAAVVRQLLVESKNDDGSDMEESEAVSRTVATLKAESQLDEECGGEALCRLADQCDYLVGSEALEAAKQCIASLDVLESMYKSKASFHISAIRYHLDACQRLGRTDGGWLEYWREARAGVDFLGSVDSMATMQQIPHFWGCFTQRDIVATAATVHAASQQLLTTRDASQLRSMITPLKQVPVIRARLPCCRVQ
jgi:hypothetical protein